LIFFIVFVSAMPWPTGFKFYDETKIRFLFYIKNYFGEK
jgi:hypothetical protein